ncbi:Ankyrin repeats (3 copies) [compost metagenome]
MATWGDYKKTMLEEDEIFEAARRNNVQALAKYLVAKGNPNLSTHKGYSLLMLAAYNDCDDACEMLIEGGADVNARDRSGNTILMGVSFKGYSQIAEILLKAGADPQAKNCLGFTAMGFAKTFRRHSLVKLLSSHVTP